ncbi:light-harvesting protein [Gracilaria domingensis]|nr:light-harvesting protein [Gracilaria domingensis]
MQEAANGNHGQAAVDKLGVLEPLEGGVGLAQSKGIKRILAGLARRTERNHLHEGGGSDDDLPEGGPQQELVHAALLDAPGVDAGRQLGGVRVPREGVELGDQDADDGEHADAGCRRRRGEEVSERTSAWRAARAGLNLQCLISASCKNLKLKTLEKPMGSKPA